MTGKLTADYISILRTKYQLGEPFCDLEIRDMLQHISAIERERDELAKALSAVISEYRVASADPYDVGYRGLDDAITAAIPALEMEP